MINKITPDQLQSWKSDHPGFEIIDVREEYEFEESNIGGKNIPLADIVERRNEFENNSAVLFCCKSGKRSAAIVYTLSNKFGLSNVYSLEGGLETILTSNKDA